MFEEDVSVTDNNGDTPLGAGMNGVSSNLRTTRNSNKAYSSDQPAGSPNCVPVQRAKTYKLAPLNQYASNYEKFARFDLAGFGKQMPESIPYCSACYLDLMIINMVANGRTGQSKISYKNLKSQKRGRDVGYKRFCLCAELRDGLFCALVYLIEDDYQHERL